MASRWVADRAEAVRDWWRGYDTGVRDRWVAVAFLALAFIPALSNVSAEFADLRPRPAGALSVILILGQTVPLAARSRRPAACLAVVGASFAAYQALGYPAQFGSVTIYLALYSAGAHVEWFRCGVAVAATAGYVMLTVVVLALGSTDDRASFVIFYLLFAACWGLGAFVRRRRLDEDVRRRLTAAAAIAAERTRIARELHDVVTHHVTAMIVQAGAAQYALGAPDPLVTALGNIGDTGRRALAELRQLLDVLSADDGDGRAAPAPGPGLGPEALRELVEQTLAGGQPVELVEDGSQSALPDAVRLAVYRVVQEGLTNAVKYAAGRPTVVRVGRRDGHVSVEVSNDAALVPLPADARRALSGGRGLSWLHERVAALGGEVTAGPQPDGRFRVRAVIPAGSGASVASVSGRD
jgi:signal transduction histidine kinase